MRGGHRDFLLHLGCMLPDMVFTYRYLLCLYRGSSRVLGGVTTLDLERVMQTDDDKEMCTVVY